MRGRERVGSLFWLAFSCYVLFGSVRLGIGAPHRPGMGFVSFWAASLLGAFSLIVLIKTFLKPGEVENVPLFSGKSWGKVALVLTSLALYSLFLRKAGYLISTFLLLCFLFGITRKGKWWWVPASAFITTVVSYYVFSKWLNLQFPEGFLGF